MEVLLTVTDRLWPAGIKYSFVRLLSSSSYSNWRSPDPNFKYTAPPVAYTKLASPKTAFHDPVCGAVALESKQDTA